MNHKFLFSLAILALPLTSCGMNSTFFKPATVIPKIRFANDSFFTINSVYAHSATKTSFDTHGKRTYLLNWNGPETLLNSYVDSTLSNDNITSAGKAYLNAQLIVNEFGLILTKNAPKGFFFETQLYIKQLHLKNIELVPLNSKNEPFNSKEDVTSENPTFATYLDDFETLYSIPMATNDKNSTAKSDTQSYPFLDGYLFAGYTHTWDHFTHLDFIDFTGKIGLTLDFKAKKDKNPILRLPLNTNNGFCAELNTSIGILNWINIGGNLSTKISTGTEQIIGLNINSIDNDFLKPHQGQATVKPGQFFYGTVYLEADHIEGGLSMLIGYSYARQRKTVIKVSNDNDSNTILNKNQSRYQGWSLGTFLFEIEYDFATEKFKNVPALKFSLFQPIHGRRAIKSATQVGSCCLQFSHKF